jgi:hypothetical protein
MLGCLHSEYSCLQDESNCKGTRELLLKCYEGILGLPGEKSFIQMTNDSIIADEISSWFKGSTALAEKLKLLSAPLF